MEGVTILVVEDEAVIALQVREELERLGISGVHTAYSGEEAVRLAKQVLPDILIMDINLGAGIDGIEVARRLQEERFVPVIYLTAYSEPGLLMRAEETFPYAYILKPFHPHQLKVAVRMALSKYKKDRELFETRVWMKALLQNLHVPFVVVDVERRIRYVSSGAEGFLLSQAKRIQGLPFSKAVPLFEETEDILHEPPFKEIIESKARHRTRAVLLREDARRISVILDIAPFYSDRDEALGCLVFFQEEGGDEHPEPGGVPARPLLGSKKSLSSFLEVEIVRLLLEHERSSSQEERAFLEGQRLAFETVLRYYTGKDVSLFN